MLQMPSKSPSEPFQPRDVYMHADTTYVIDGIQLVIVIAIFSTHGIAMPSHPIPSFSSPELPDKTRSCMFQAPGLPAGQSHQSSAPLNIH
jgi:hypothetical protein